MTVKEAYAKVKQQNLGKKCICCDDFGGFWLFDFIPCDWPDDTLHGGGYDAVDKKTGKIFLWNPVENLSLLDTAKNIPLSELED